MDEQKTGLDVDFQTWTVDLVEPPRPERLGSFASLVSLCSEAEQTTGWISTIIQF
jgi:hypothetical protein